MISWNGITNNIKAFFKTDWGSSYYLLKEFSASWKKSRSHSEKVKLILENPAALFLFVLLSELYSMGEFILKGPDGEPIEKHPLLDLLKNPNPMQTGDQFLWDYMFHRKMGVANLYIDSKVPDRQNKMYFLNPDYIVWPEGLKQKRKSILLSSAAINQVQESLLRYKTDHQDFDFKYKKLLQFFDLSNGLDGWFTSPSRVDALYKIVSNSEAALGTKNVNLNFLSKFIVSGKVDTRNTSQQMMGEKEKESVRDSMRSSESIYPTKTNVDINRFIEDSGILKSLGESFMTDAFLIGKVLNVPKDVTEMLGDSTYENQEKARASVISYCIQADANDFCSGILKYFNMEEYELELDYTHLPFVQVFESDRATTLKLKAEAFMKFIDAGAKPEEVAILLELDEYFTSFNPPNQRAQAPEQQTQETKIRKIS